MKSITIITWLGMLLLATFNFSGCIKDSGFARMKVYTPVYATTDQVRASIKSDVPVEISHPGKMFVKGNYIFLNETGRGVHIIDNSNPSAPVNKAFINIPGNEDISVNENMLYADCFTDLMAIDITDPDNVVFKKAVANIFPERQYVLGIQLASNTVITNWVVRDTTIDIPVTEGNGIWKNGNYYSGVFYTANDFYAAASYNNLTSSSGGSKGVAGSMARFALLNDYLYSVTRTSLNVLDVRQSTDPKWTKKVDLGNSIETIFPFKNKLFIGSTTGMLIFDASNPESPSKLGSFGHVLSCDPVIADDKYAYVTLSSGTTCGGTVNQLHVLDITNITEPLELKTYNLTSPKGLSKDGNNLFICDGFDGLKVFDATDVNNIKQIKKIDIPDTYDVICLNKLAIVSAADGLYQCDYSDINNVHIISKINVHKN